jgi:S-DNA-T family DNA segregation ATPase FtsK/SpoIIIE
MLYSMGSGQMMRAHGPFVTDEEVESIAEALRQQGPPRYLDDITDTPSRSEAAGAQDRESRQDDLYDKAVAIVLRDRKVSTSYLQRRLSIGYNRAADVVERMEREGLIGPANNVGKREILLTARDDVGQRVAS